jgi:hypothetical protein
MLVESLTALGLVIDRLIQLIQRRETLNRTTFADFVVPVMIDFEAVHKDYSDSFKRYREMLKDIYPPFDLSHPVFEAIENDREFAKDLQMKAKALTQLGNLDPRLFKFACSIERYFHICRDDITKQPKIVFAPTHPFEGCSARTEIQRDLGNVAAGPAMKLHKYREAVSTVMDTLRSLQNSYRLVFEEFTKLKTELLIPI